MRLDQYSNPVFNDDDLFKALYQGHKLTSDMFVESSTDTASLQTVSGLKFLYPLDDYDISVQDYDQAMQADWHMPDEYKTMDIMSHIVSRCPEENLTRVSEELIEFENRNMINLLRWLKYFVDIMDKNGLVWGVGRGSSVASYVLFLLGVHSVDSVKYKLDWREFLR